MCYYFGYASSSGSQFHETRRVLTGATEILAAPRHLLYSRHASFTGTMTYRVRIATLIACNQVKGVIKAKRLREHLQYSFELYTKGTIFDTESYPYTVERVCSGYDGSRQNILLDFVLLPHVHSL